MADWKEIKSEYISTEIGYRELAEKHRVSFSTLQKRAKKEDWPGLRRQLCEEVVTAVTNSVANEQAERAVRLMGAADALLGKIELTISNIDGRKSSRAVKDVADSLKTVKDILDIKSQADMDEQAARIAKLKKDAEDETEAPEIVVTFEGGCGDWCN